MAGRTLSTGIPDQIQVTEAFRDPLSEPCNLDFRYQLEMKGAGTVSTYVYPPCPRRPSDIADLAND